MAKKSKAAIAADSYNAIVGDVYDLVPDAKWDGKSWKGTDGTPLVSTATIKWAMTPSATKPAMRASDIKMGREKNPLAFLYDTYLGSWGAVLVAMGVFCRCGYARTEGYLNAIARWLTENDVSFKLSIKDGKEYVVCTDMKRLAEALGCQ